MRFYARHEDAGFADATSGDGARRAGNERFRLCGDTIMSEVNYRRNGMKYSTTGKCWGMAPKAGGFASDLPPKGPKPKSSRERRAAKKGK